MPNLIDVTMPTDQAEGTESVMGTWFKQVGDTVAENEPLLEIATDKVTVEIAAPAAGILREILKEEGDPIDPGTVLGRIEAGATAASPPASVPTPAPTPAPGRLERRAAAAGVPELTPVVRRMIERHGLDPALIPGTGRGGRITAQDVEAHLTSGATTPAPAQGTPGRRVPHTAMRKRIAAHMVQSMATAPHVTSVFEADLTAVLAHKEVQSAAGNKTTLSAYFVRASCEAMKVVPEVNSRWHDDALELFDAVHLGVATALEGEAGGGLIVPVIHDAHTLDLAATAGRLADLTARARGGTLEPRDVQGGTFTLSNHGVSGSLLAAPIIINQPQSAILGIGKLERRVRVLDDERTAVCPMVYVSLTIDHRVLDGHRANRWLSAFVRALERWT